MYKFFVFVILIFITLSNFSSICNASEPPTVEWYKIFGGKKYDSAMCHIQTTDGGYAIVGSTTSLKPDGKNFWLVKTDENGTIEWNKAYGGSGDDFAYCIIQTNDGGYAIAGSTNSFDSKGDFDFLLIKTNSTGRVDWYKTYGNLFDDHATTVIQTNDGGYAIAGVSNTSTKNNDFLLIKTDHNGSIEWNARFGHMGDDSLWSLIQTKDFGFAIVGSTESFEGKKKDFWLVRTDESGNELWNKTYGGSDEDSAQSIVQTNEGEYLIGGETKSFGSGNYDYWLIKVDENGSMLWSRIYGGKDEDSLQSIIRTEDGYALGGFSENILYYDFYLVKINFDGFVQWQQKFSFGSDEKSYSLIQANDGNYSMVGSSQTEKGYNYFVLKTNNTNETIDNLSPIADAGIDSICKLNSKVYFNGSGFDSDGSISLFQWDFNSDGIYDWESNTTAETTYIFNKTGTYYAILKVTDDNRSSSTDMKIISIYPINKASVSNAYLYIIFALIAFMILFLAVYKISKKHIKLIFRGVVSKYFSFFLRLNKWEKRLILSFIIITGIKTSISLIFSTPTIYNDEQIYGVMAREIFNGNLFFMGRTAFQPGPVVSGYSYFLAPSYILGQNMNLVYHAMLFTNCILTSALIFPVFHIMKFFVNKKISFISAISITILPTILTYNFLIMAENAFYFVFLISCYLLIRVFTYKNLDKNFIILSLISSFSVGFLVMIKPTGLAMIASLFFVFLYKIIKERKKSIKYSIVILPILAFGFLVNVIESKNISDYPFVRNLDKLSLIFSDASSFIDFMASLINETGYLIIMSYIVFTILAIFLFINFRKIENKKRDKFQIFALYGLLSIFFLIVIENVFLLGSNAESEIISRYLSPGVLIIFMLGMIGIDIFKKIKDKKKIFQLIIISIMTCTFLIFAIPVEFHHNVNSLDLVWAMNLKDIRLYTFTGIEIFQIILGAISIFLIYILIYILFFKKSISLPIKKFRPMFLLALIIFLSLLIFYPSASYLLNEQRTSISKGYNEPARWFMENDSFSTIVMEDSYGAFSGGGMYKEHWGHMFADMNFWIPNGEIYICDKEKISSFFTAKVNADYILSTHDLTDYYQSLADFYIQDTVFKRQDTVDWHIYKVN